jgi:hypothetical protein
MVHRVLLGLLAHLQQTEALVQLVQVEHKALQVHLALRVQAVLQPQLAHQGHQVKRVD